MTAVWWTKPRRVSVCVDTPGWFDPHAQALVAAVAAGGDEAAFVRNCADVMSGGVAFYLSCLKITPPDVLARNPHNLVVHSSDLPRGRGFSPLVWQVLEGADTIPLTMIFAAEAVDAGHIVAQRHMSLDGSELNNELRDRMGREIVAMCLDYLALPAPPAGRPQRGEASWYRRRRSSDSALDPHRSIADQFNLLRVVDNDRYPAFFDLNGFRYTLRIERQALPPAPGTVERSG